MFLPDNLSMVIYVISLPDNLSMVIYVISLPDNLSMVIYIISLPDNLCVLLCIGGMYQSPLDTRHYMTIHITLLYRVSSGELIHLSVIAKEQVLVVRKSKLIAQVNVVGASLMFQLKNNRFPHLRLHWGLKTRQPTMLWLCRFSSEIVVTDTCMFNYTTLECFNYFEYMSL